MATSTCDKAWRPALRDFCEAFTHIKPCPDFAKHISPDNYIWQNTTPHKIPGGGIVCIFDPVTLEPLRLGITAPGCAICPGQRGRLHTSGVIELRLKSPWVGDIQQGAKIYVEKQPDGTWRATDKVPAVGFSVGRAVINPDSPAWCNGEAAKTGSLCVLVHFDCCEKLEVFGITNQDDKNPEKTEV